MSGSICNFTGSIYKLVQSVQRGLWEERVPLSRIAGRKFCGSSGSSPNAPGPPEPTEAGRVPSFESGRVSSALAAATMKQLRKPASVVATTAEVLDLGGHGRNRARALRGLPAGFRC